MGIVLIFLLASAASLVKGNNFMPCNDCEPKPFSEALDLASLRLLQKVYALSDDKHMVLSPLGVFTLLSLYVSDIEGQVADEIVDFLRAANKTQLTDSYRKLSRELSGMNPDVLGFLNNVYVDSQFTLDYNFFLNARSYKSEVNTIDFKDPKSAAETINEWVSTKTKGKINKIVSEDDIMYDPLLVALYNVIYFKGHWAVPFDERFTKEDCFLTGDDQLIKKPMMHLLQSMDYYEDEEAGVPQPEHSRMIQLPYKESKLKMVVVLPSSMDSLSMVLRRISETGLLHYVNRMNQSEIKINLELPRFEIKSKYDIASFLPEVGISSIFNEPVYGVVNEDLVTVDEVFQEAFITVDEKGSTAGEAKGFHPMPYSGLPNSIPFKVDHPFLFAILYDDIILLIGTCAR